MAVSIAVPKAPIGMWQAQATTLRLPLHFTHDPTTADVVLGEAGCPFDSPFSGSPRQCRMVLGEERAADGDRLKGCFVPVPDPRFLQARIESGLWAVLRHLRRAERLEAQQAQRQWQEVRSEEHTSELQSRENLVC